jgi:small-conductance mechanosensitive channel/CRP-like cAMP-binding protein
MKSLLSLNFTSEMLGIPLAVALLLVAVLLLPRSARIRARQGAVSLGLSIVCGTLRLLFPTDLVISRALLFAATFFLLASMGRSIVLIALDVVVERRSARTTPRIFRDLSTGVIYLVVGLVALRAIDVEPGSILTTSALLTAVVGLAMQDTLGNLVSGLALQMQRPFDVGDWIEVGSGEQAGRVTEVTWRATTVMTLDHVEVILPNANLAKAAIRNYSRPSPISRRRIVVGVSYAAAPHDVHTALVAAAREVQGVLANPPPSSRNRAFADSAVEYELFFFIDDFSIAPRLDGAVRDRVYYALARAGIEIPYPTRTVHALPPPDTAATRREETARFAKAIAALDLAQPLPDDARLFLAERAHLRIYGPGEAIVRQGDSSDELFIIESGLVGIEIRHETPALPPQVAGALAAAQAGAAGLVGGAAATPLGTSTSPVTANPRTVPPPRAHEVAELGAGQCFGEMGLLTGEKRAATVRAKKICRLVVVDHESFHGVLAAHPEVVERMGLLLASRQAALDAAATTRVATPAPEERSRRFISQIREFFKLV